MIKRRITVGFAVATSIFAGTAGWYSRAALATTEKALVAHEWGTFTSLQDDDGTAIGAINADDEPVPWFVCNDGAVQTVSARSELTPKMAQSKGIVACHPGVTMRLETPVIYFYPPENGPKPSPFNVHVTFRGGWLTEYFPRAAVDAPELEHAWNSHPPLTSATRGSLTWKDVEVGTAGTPPPTDDPVWTAPREVARAAMVKALAAPDWGPGHPNDPEKFLFYRGVGHLDSPLRVVHEAGTDQLSLYPDLSALGTAAPGPADADLRIPAAWLIEIRPEDGQCAFRPVATPLDLRTPAGQRLATVGASFAPAEFGAQRLPELREAMHKELVGAGLFPDEAAAMLKTWELSYFKSPGKRLFFVTPRGWTDAVLPLTIDGAQVTRVMIGRIEMVTPAQREHLARLTAGPNPDVADMIEKRMKAEEALSRARSERLEALGKTSDQMPWRSSSLTELKIPLPGTYRDYVALGRFRDALVLREQQQRPTAMLAAFINGGALRDY